MHSILIESSTSHSLISINKDHLPINYKYLSFKEDFTYQIKKLLKQKKLSIKDISYISMGKGPGSFTGIRKAASISKAISYATGIPIIGFCSLKSFIPDKDGKFLSILKAKSKYFYMIIGEKKRNDIIYKSSLKLILKDKIHEYNYQIISPLNLDSLDLDSENYHLKNYHLRNYQKKVPDKNHLAVLTYGEFLKKNFSFSDNLKLYMDFK